MVEELEEGRGFAEEREEETLVGAVGEVSPLLADSHVERWIDTLGQRLSRFVRKTLSFSEPRQMHTAA